MEANNTTNNSGLLLKLTRLEEQVVSLTKQVESDKNSINQLKQLVTDRDIQITELEAKLAVAHSSLQPTVMGAIAQCRELARNGVDGKIIRPVLGQIQKIVDSVRHLMEETRIIIVNRKNLLNSGFGSTSELMRQGPDQVKTYLDQNLLAPLNEMADKVMVWSNDYYRQGLHWYQQELGRGQNLSKRLTYLARELPLDAKIMVQTRVVDPMLVQLDHLPGLMHKYSEMTKKQLQELIRKIRQWLQALLDYIGELIRKSSFWDGKHRMAGAA